ncbi:MAG: hypothetical protein H6709_04255 [Kofleriaceae bacterium]|nr:hypothetical protein [Kofleriaceae bacterium]
MSAPAPARLRAAAGAADEDAAAPAVADQELGASLGVAIGGAQTAGGLRVEGHYLYQLSDVDWFDGRVAFTFGSGGAACFRDRADELVCDHGAADGFAGELGGGVRRWLGGQQGFRPWAEAGAAVRMIRFGDDDLTGVALPLSLAGGVRARAGDLIAIGGFAALEVGPAVFGGGLGASLQAGLVVGVTVDFAMP